MSLTVQEGKYLSDLVGAHDLSDFVLEVCGVSETCPATLERGDILAKTINGNMTLVGAEGTTAQECYGARRRERQWELNRPPLSGLSNSNKVSLNARKETKSL
jgi:hypothetical protein